MVPQDDELDDDTGREDPPNTDDDTEGDDDADDDGDDDGPKQTEGEKRLAKALAAARRERNELRKELSEARKGAKKADDGDQEAADEAVGKLEGRLVRQAALTELTGAGLSREQAKKAVNLLDLSDVTVDEDGDVDLGDQIDGLKEDFPELFAGKGRSSTPPVRRAGQDGRRDNGKNVDQKFADRLMRSAGYR